MNNDYSNKTLIVEGNNEFTLTANGIVRFAYYLAEHNNSIYWVQHSRELGVDKDFIACSILHSIIDTYDNHLILSKNIKAFDEAIKYLMIKSPSIPEELYAPLNKFTDNIVLYMSDCYFKTDLLEFKGITLKKEYKKAIRMCDCGDLYLDQDIVDDLGLNIVSGVMGINGNCGYCAKEFGGYKRCGDCGRLVREIDAFYVENTEDYICEDCKDRGEYNWCENCDRLVYTGNGDGCWTNDGNFYCCDICANGAGYCWSDRREEWISEDEYYEEDIENYVYSYHHTPSFRPILSVKDAKRKFNKYIGVEIECDGKCIGDFDSDYWSNICNMLGDHAFATEDGSVGVEFVSNPHTINSFYEFDWEKIFEKLSTDGWRSHDTDTCGQHFHFSCWWLGNNKAQCKNNAKKICAFFENNWDDLVKFSRRNESQLHWCNKRGTKITKETPYGDLLYDRYYAVNLRNLSFYGDDKNTIEIRLPRGTLNYNTFRANADFLTHIVKNAKNISWKNINNLKLWFKGIKDKNTIDYIKSRNCFEGSF